MLNYFNLFHCSGGVGDCGLGRGKGNCGNKTNLCVFFVLVDGSSLLCYCYFLYVMLAYSCSVQ